MIVGWLPATATDEALWHVQHLDGDEEDLDEDEVIDCLVPIDDKMNESDPKGSAEASTGDVDNAMDVIDLSEDSPIKRRPTEAADKTSAPVPAVGAMPSRSSRSSLVASSTGKNSDSEDEFEDDEKLQPVVKIADVPSIVRQSSGLARGIPPWRASPLTNAVGPQAICNEVSRVLGLMNEELRRRGGGFSRESRREWEQSLRDAETTADLRSPLLELEALVRDLQTAEDKRDAEEVRLAKQAEREDMIKEGWLFESGANEFIGMQARRFFKGFGTSDGVIVAYLPPEKNDSVALYHMEHVDGDCEDLELHDLHKALRSFEQDLKEDEDEENADSDAEEDSDDEESSVGSTDSGNDDDHLYAPDGAGATLWPTYEVRQRWIGSLANAQTIGEVGLALLAFTEQAEAFGVIVPDPALQDKALKPRQARLALKASAYKVDSEDVWASPPDSPQRSSHRSNRIAKSKQIESGRPSRAAARSVKSYAE